MNDPHDTAKTAEILAGMADDLAALAAAETGDLWSRWRLFTRAAEGYDRAATLYTEASRAPTFDEIHQKRNQWRAQAVEARADCLQAIVGRDDASREFAEQIAATNEADAKEAGE